jgi:hypothetical protein
MVALAATTAGVLLYPNPRFASEVQAALASACLTPAAARLELQLYCSTLQALFLLLTLQRLARLVAVAQLEEKMVQVLLR